MRAAVYVLLALAGCDTTTFDIDRFPIQTRDASLPLVEVAVGDEAPVPAVLDTGSPLTLVAGLRGRERQRADLELHGYGGPGGVPVPRAVVQNALVVSAPVAQAGLAAGGLAAYAIGVVIGGDVLSRYAVRLDLQDDSVRLFPGLAGDDELLGRECAAVISTDTGGGGSVLIDDIEVSTPATRLVMGACVNQATMTPLARPAGADMLLVVATGVPVTVLSRSAYARATGRPFDGTGLETGELFLPGGTQAVSVHLATLDKLALVGDRIEDKGPCEELWTAQHAAIGSCCRQAGGGASCPCTIDGDECQAPAVLEVCGALRVAVVADTERFLQSLREELRPQYADVDGLIGADVLEALAVDIDYPGGRTVLRCKTDAPAGITSCLTLPRMDDSTQAADVVACLPTLDTAACVALEALPESVTCPTPLAPAPNPP